MTPATDSNEGGCATAVKPHPSQLLLPFSDGQTTDVQTLSSDSVVSDFEPVPVRCSIPAAITPLLPSKRLEALRGYLLRNFLGFVLQQRTQPAGTVQLSLYRIPDGAFYRINVTSRFLEGDWLEEVDGFLEFHGLCQKVPASVLTPIIIDRDGIHVPRPPLPPDEGGDLLRLRLRKILGWKGKEEATGLSFAP